MALALQAYTFAYQYTNSWIHSPPKKNPSALNLGILSTATINAAAVIHPAETHPDINLYAIASRALPAAQKAAKRYKIRHAYGSYSDLLADTNVDIVYISTPNSLHFEWALKALKAGKHVLLEKPFTSNAAEAKKLIAVAEEEGKVLEEAFHWQFHPAAHAWREIIDSGRYGKVISTVARMTASPGVPAGDIRWEYDLSGGSFMDMTYALSFTRYALTAGLPAKIMSAVARPYAKDERVDEAMTATVLFKDARGDVVQSRIYTDMAREWVYGAVPRLWEAPSIEVETDNAVIYFYNAMMPHIYHYISVTDKRTGKTQIKKQYKGGPKWGDVQTSDGVGGQAAWSTYRWQLEAFVTKCKGEEPASWVTNEESITQMETIDMIYKHSGMPLRPKSKFAI